MRVVLREKAKWFNKMRAADRCPEKAGVGGSIPSLATMFSSSYRHSKSQFHSVSFQYSWSAGMRQRDESGFGISSVVHHHHSSGESGSMLPALPCLILQGESREEGSDLCTRLHLQQV